MPDPDPRTDPDRILVVGAGAIGGALAVELDHAGFAVEVVARGAHLDAIRRDGLVRRAPDGTRTARLAAHARVRDARVDEGTVVLLATKVHQVEPLLDELLAVAGPDVPVACLHNGVEGERLALRRFASVQGVLINVPGVHLRPGVVETYAAVPRGVLDVGRYPSGVDATTRALAAAFTAAGYLSEACEDVMARKWSKLLGNVGNALQVLCGRPHLGWDRLYEVVRGEAEAVVAAAGIAVDREAQQARSEMVARADIDGVAKSGGSTWQSATRGTGDVETVALNGEISLLGRLHGVPTPANDLVAAETLALVAAGDEVGSRDQDALLARLD